MQVSADLPLQTPELIAPAPKSALLPTRARVRLEGCPEAGTRRRGGMFGRASTTPHCTWEGDVPGSGRGYGVCRISVMRGSIFSSVPERIHHHVCASDCGYRKAQPPLHTTWSDDSRGCSLSIGWCWYVLSFWASGFCIAAQFPGVREILSNLLLLPQSEDKIVGGAWTLVYEIVFYCVFAIAICNRLVGAVVRVCLGGAARSRRRLFPASRVREGCCVRSVATSPSFWPSSSFSASVRRPFFSAYTSAAQRPRIKDVIGLVGFAFAGVCGNLRSAQWLRGHGIRPGVRNLLILGGHLGSRRTRTH